MVKTVAVIGAGASGLCALRHLTSQPNNFLPVGFERYPYPGGTWVYTETVGRDLDGLPVHSSMYKGLRTNLPKDVMMFPDFPFPKKFPSFPGHEEVLQYLNRYMSKHDLAQYIKFQTLVTGVRPLTPGAPDTAWEVTYQEVAGNSPTETKIFDSVWICNGHYFKPIIPEVKGQEKFQGELIHIHDLRNLHRYSGKTVVCLGAGPSGLDVVTELSAIAKTVLFGHYDLPIDIPLPENCRHFPPIDHVTETSVVFTNGDVEEVDVIILCTGYQYHFPFLDPAGGVVLKDGGRRVTPLYKHVVNTQHPSLFFIGLLHFVIPFTTFDLQVRFAMKILDGSLRLPSKQEMDSDTQQELEEKIDSGFDSRHFHRLLGTQSLYCDSLCELAGLEKLSEGRRTLYNYVIQSVFAKPATYKNVNFEMDQESFKIVQGIEPLTSKI